MSCFIQHLTGGVSLICFTLFTSFIHPTRSIQFAQVSSPLSMYSRWLTCSLSIPSPPLLPASRYWNRETYRDTRKERGGEEMKRSSGKEFTYMLYFASCKWVNHKRIHIVRDRQTNNNEREYLEIYGQHRWLSDWLTDWLLRPGTMQMSRQARRVARYRGRNSGTNGRSPG